MGWPASVGVVLADGTALHHRCSELFHIERMRRRAENAFSADAMADEAELCIRGELLT
jgi:hypothetical protein